jgi:glycosyltransferase involved in cell wall biosynthesis
MKVSIYTPTHNSQWLKEIYQNLLEQTYQNWEWVIVYNNGALVLEFGDSRVVSVVIAEPVEPWVGPMKARACEECSGEILLELDHDDLLMPEAIAEVVQAFQDNPNVGFVYSNTVHCTTDFVPIERFSEAHGWFYRQVEYHGHTLDECISYPPYPETICLPWCCPNHLRAMRTAIYKQVGGYNKEMRIFDDIDLMCRLYSITEFLHIDKGLYIYRYHGQNTWVTAAEEIAATRDNMYYKYLDSLISIWCERQGLRKIEIGGRMAAQPGYETLDLLDADIIHDLNTPWPFADSSVGVIRAMDVIEHLDDKIFTMKEIQRVLAPGGFALLQVPSTDGRGAFQDPTHVSFWNENSFWYYTRASQSQYINTPVRFQALKLYTTAMNDQGVCWVIAHLLNLKDSHRPAGQVLI